jgi:hypothetical protein
MKSRFAPCWRDKAFKVMGLACFRALKLGGGRQGSSATPRKPLPLPGLYRTKNRFGLSIGEKGVQGQKLDALLCAHLTAQPVKARADLTAWLG